MQSYNKQNPFTHIQSMFFIIDKEYLDFFNEDKINKINNLDDLIINYEIGLSQHALTLKWFYLDISR